jgi:hypothetical protein
VIKMVVPGSALKADHEWMPTPTPRLRARILKDFPMDTVEEVIGWLGGLRIEEYGGQDVERMQAALVLAANGRWDAFMSVIRVFRTDWRDALMAGGLGHADWPDRLNAELSDSNAP